MNKEAFLKIELATNEAKPVNLEELIRSLGIELDKKAKLDEGIAGKIERLESGRFKISINKNDHYFRQRFTMAHELGHFLLHEDLMGDGIEDTTLYRSPKNSAVTVTHEIEANRFAASILMPLRHVKSDYEEKGRDVKAVAKKWLVSPKAMSIRLGLT